MNYCTAILRPEGIACTLREGHDEYLDEDGRRWDHCNVARLWLDGKPTRHPGPSEWGFNDPEADRKRSDFVYDVEQP